MKRFFGAVLAGIAALSLLFPVRACAAQKPLSASDENLLARTLAEKCPEVGAHFIDIATNLKGEDGLMKKGISHDGEYHLNEQGNAIWAQALLDFAQAQYDLGLWVPAP